MAETLIQLHLVMVSGPQCRGRCRRPCLGPGPPCRQARPLPTPLTCPHTVCRAQRCGTARAGPSGGGRQVGCQAGNHRDGACEAGGRDQEAGRALGLGHRSVPWEGAGRTRPQADRESSGQGDAWGLEGPTTPDQRQLLGADKSATCWWARGVSPGPRPLSLCSRGPGGALLAALRPV